MIDFLGFLFWISYLLLIIYFRIGLGRFKVRRDNPTVDGLLCSVVVAVRNEEHSIGTLLEDLKNQDYDLSKLEVIISDDFSTDGTVAVVENFLHDHPEMDIKLVNPLSTGDSTGGKKRAIERGVASSHGEVILFTDGDTRVESGWVSTMTGCFSHPGIRMVMGPVVYKRNGSLLQRLLWWEFAGIMGVTAGAASHGRPVMCNGANLAVWRNDFTDLKGYSGNRRYASGDDQFLMYDVQRKYGRGSVAFAMERQAVVSTAAAAELRMFLNQRIRWISKSPSYRDLPTVITGMITSLLVLALFMTLICSFFLPGAFFTFLFLLIAKSLTDLMMVIPMARFFGMRFDAGTYLLSQLFQVFYVPVCTVAGLRGRYTWKGRSC